MNGTVIVLKVLVAIVLLASAPLALKRRWRLFLALPLSVFQGFVPWSQIAGVPIPLAFWGGLVLWPEFVKEFRNVIAWKPTASLCGIVVMFIVSILWSPSRKAALAPIGYTCQFLVIFAAVVAEGRRDPKTVLRLLVVTVAFALVQATAVAVFRFMPGVKLGYYLSTPARFFISPNLLDTLFTTSRNNVLSPSKSGGITIVDANDGSAYLGVLAFVALGLALHLRRRWLGVASVVLLGTIAFTGSKAGLMLAMIVPVIALYFISIHYRGWRHRVRMTMVGILLAGTLVLLVPKAIQIGESASYRALDSFLSRSDTTLAVREEIWSYGLQAFLQHPLLGEGFGGWQHDFPMYAYKVGIDPNLPPHNSYIYLWAQGGLLAGVLGLTFTWTVMRLGLRQLGDLRADTFPMCLAMTMAYLWTFLHGLGNNSGVLGEMHMSPVLASLLALGYLSRRSSSAAEKSAWPVTQTGSLGDVAPATLA